MAGPIAPGPLRCRVDKLLRHPLLFWPAPPAWRRSWWMAQELIHPTIEAIIIGRRLRRKRTAGKLPSPGPTLVPMARPTARPMRVPVRRGTPQRRPYSRPQPTSRAPHAATHQREAPAAPRAPARRFPATETPVSAARQDARAAPSNPVAPHPRARPAQPGTVDQPSTVDQQRAIMVGEQPTQRGVVILRPRQRGRP